MKTNQAGPSLLNVGSWLQESRRLLEDRQGIDPDEAGVTLQALLADQLGRSRAWILANPEFLLSGDQQVDLNSLLHRLASGEPLPYLTGRQEFFGLEFEVNPDVLIPRPETELLVERALSWIASHPDCKQGADVGTGSGCIAISLAAQAKTTTWLAVDRSRAALLTARRNAARHGVCDRVRFLQCDLLAPYTGQLDLVCANLPYIPSRHLADLPVARFEPRLALDGGGDGLSLIRALLASAPRWLAPGGLLLMEMQFDQGKAITEMAAASLPGSRAVILPDLAGLPRVVEIQNN